jgi:hypothetical protein
LFLALPVWHFTFDEPSTGSNRIGGSHSEEHSMSANNWVRQVHRWVSIVFTLAVAANFAAMTQGEPPPWITYSPLLPLFILLFTGLYLFALPYLNKRRARRE